MTPKPLFFAGNSNRDLSEKVCQLLQIQTGKVNLGQFPDGEINIQILEDVKGKDIYVLQSIAQDPNYFLMELLLIIDALKREGARSITTIIPYLGYSRQDRKNVTGVPIAAKLVANMLSVAGINRLVTFDLHSDQLEGFFEIPVDHLHCQSLISQHALEFLGNECIVVAPDVGSIKIAENMAKYLSTELVVIKKERMNSFEVHSSLIGEVKGKNVLIIDDLCSTGGTIIAAAKLCREKGAKKIIGAVTHGLFVNDALDKIQASELEVLLVTDTICQEQSILNSKIRVISVAPLLVDHLGDL
ncbi:MAG: ribose-phosphate pyrophosphokinase [Parachlamydiaceae bacterium]|nr:ribose-phosphate pyrophosphokinase [Parachlamydiaceae bacterium]